MSRHAHAAALLLLLPASGTDARAEGLERLQSRMIEAAGGEEAWRSVSALKLTGVRNRNGYEMGLVTWRARPDRVRVERTLRGQKQVFVFDGERGWLKGFREDVFSPADDAQIAENLGEVERYLRWPGTGRLPPDASMDSPDAHPTGPLVRLSLTAPSGDPEVWLVERESGRLTEIVEHRVDDEGGSYEVHTFFFDEREVEGLRFPFYVEIDHGTSLYSFEVESIEVNPALDDGLFTPSLTSSAPALQRD